MNRPRTPPPAIRADAALTRRWFFQECGVGLGAIALASLLGSAAVGAAHAAARRPARAEGAALRAARPSASSTCSWPGRRATSSCSTTSRSWPSATASCRRRSCSRATAPRSSTRTRRCSGRSSSSPSTASAARSCPSCCRTWRSRGRHRDRQVDGRPTRSTTRPAQILMNTGAQQFGRPSIGAWATYGLGSESQDLPGFVVFSTGRRAPAAAARTGAAASCRRSTRACRSAAAATRCCTCPTRAGVDDELQRDSLDALRELNQHAPRRGRRSGDRHAHQLASRWRSACRPARRS